MKCPHCGRTWADQDLIRDGLSPSVVLSDHVHRFCSGNPAAPATGPRRQDHLAARRHSAP